MMEIFNSVWGNQWERIRGTGHLHVSILFYLLKLLCEGQERPIKICLPMTPKQKGQEIKSENYLSLAAKQKGSSYLWQWDRSASAVSLDTGRDWGDLSPLWCTSSLLYSKFPWEDQERPSQNFILENPQQKGQKYWMKTSNKWCPNRKVSFCFCESRMGLSLLWV